MSKENSQASKTDATIKVIFVFLFCALSFAIGTFVGKKFSDNQHRLTAMSETKKESVERSTASIPPDVDQVKPDNALSDDEIAQLADEFMTDDEKAAASADTASKEESDVAESIAANKVPDMGDASAKKDSSARGPSSLPQLAAQSAVGKYTVQVASYSTEAEAKDFAKELQGKGYSAFYVPAQVRGQTWYRVSVGLFATQVEATNYRTKLLSQAKLNSAIIQKIAQ